MKPSGEHRGSRKMRKGVKASGTQRQPSGSVPAKAAPCSDQHTLSSKLSWPAPFFSNDTGTNALSSCNHLTRTKILLSNDGVISIITNSCWTARCYSICTACWKIPPRHLQDCRHRCTDPVWTLLLLEVSEISGRIRPEIWVTAPDITVTIQSTAVILFLLSLSSNPFCLSKQLGLCCFISKTKIYLEKFVLTISNWNKMYWREMPTREHLFILISYTWNAVCLQWNTVY